MRVPTVVPAVDELEPPLPTRIHLEVTNRCNSKCEVCARTVAPEADLDLDPRDVERIVEALPALDAVALHVNGEPLLYPYLPRLLAALGGTGTGGPQVVLNTNGLALHGRRAGWLLDSGLDGLNVSMDAATAETYLAVRGVDSFPRVVRNVEGFLNRRGARSTPRVSLWMITTRRNLHELPALVDLAASLGAEEVYLQRLVHFGAGLAREEDSLHGRLGPAERDHLARAVETAARLGITLRACGRHDPREMLSASPDAEPWRSCRRPWQSVVVMANGDVVPCCISTFVAPREAIRMGNVLESGWEAVWRGDPYRRHRERLLAGPGPDFCLQCGLCWSL